MLKAGSQHQTVNFSLPAASPSAAASAFVSAASVFASAASPLAAGASAEPPHPTKDKAIADASKVAKITGQNLDPGYRYTVENKQTSTKETKYATALDFTSDVFFTNNASEEEGKYNIAYKISVTKAVNAAYITQSKGIYKPIYEDYEKYVAGETLSSATKTAVTTYYVPAINNLLKVNGVTNAATINKLLDACTTYLANVTWSVADNNFKAQVEALMADTYTTPEAE